MSRRPRLRAEPSRYSDDEGNVLLLRGSMGAAARMRYARIRSGAGLPATATREDVWQREVEFLFEQLAVSWEIAGTEPLTRQDELLARYRVATSGERASVREALRRHCELLGIDAP